MNINSANFLFTHVFQCEQIQGTGISNETPKVVSVQEIQEPAHH